MRKHAAGYRDITDSEFAIEIPNGKEFEMYSYGGWIKGTFPALLDQNKELDEYRPDDVQRLAHAITRIKI